MLFGMCLLGNLLIAQPIKGVSDKMESRPGTPIVCYPSDIPNVFRVPAPDAILRRLPNARTAAATSQFIVTYDSAMPEAAKKAFQYAVDIWQSILISKIPIRVNAQWGGNLSAGALAATSPWTYYRNFPGAQKYVTWYPVALAEKILEREINGTNPDIVITIGTTINWYYGTDGTPPANQYDFTSTILHELCHGLGFTGSFYNDKSGASDVGSYGFGDNTPAVYDRYIENAAAKQLISFTNNSSALAAEITSRKLYFNGPILANTANKGDKVPVYAPAQYSVGSTIYHLAETFNNTQNALMTYSVNPGQSILNPGPVTKAILGEMGWAALYFNHTVVSSTEDPNAIPVKVVVRGDSAVNAGSVKLVYYVNNFTTKNEAVMTPTGTANEYTASIPGSSANRTIGYYITANDKAGRSYTIPAPEPQLNTNGPNVYVFSAGTDATPPVISHQPLTFLFSTSTQATLLADVTDNFGWVDAVKVEYQVNGVAQTALPMTLNDTTGYYQATLKFTNLKANDVIKYRIVANDKAKAKNQSASPTTDFYSVPVYGVRTAQTTYENNFDASSASSDFVGIGFTINTPADFNSPCMNTTPHPYADGAAPSYENNYIYSLLTPITVAKSDATISFDEVVLVEPGETGSQYGDSDFYDYVVVEGSKDGGKTWVEFADGYDSNSKTDWLNAWKKAVDNNGNSTTTGSASLYKNRTINILGNGYFKAGDNVLIRFRLFSDELAHGWGWAVDNLRIQLPPVTAVPVSVSETDIQIAPNPNTGRFLLNGTFKENTGKVNIAVINALGQTVYTDQINSAAKVQKELDLTSLAPGVYFMNVQTTEAQITKRVMITK